MLMQMIDCMIEQDPSLSARRTIDMRRYIVNRWNRTHEDPINEDAVALFLCDENRGTLTDEQRIFARECREECVLLTKEAAHMRDTLENLYFGNITPNDQIVKSGTALKKAMEQSAECEEKLTALLEDKEKTLLLRLINAENEIGSTMALENFILGFRLGVRMILEALDEDDGSLLDPNKEG